MRPIAVGFALTAALLIPRPAHAQVPAAGVTFLFIADGAGDSSAVSDNLPEAMSRLRVPLCPQTIPWCRYGVIWQDYQDGEAQLAAAARLARYAQFARQTYPGCRIVFLGHSAGTRVVLAAAEMMPPASVDRIVLLASSLSFGYDLSGALRASCGGIDNFYSPYDGLLGLTPTAGTTDGLLATAAGVIGFRCPPGGDVALYHGLRQYRWSESLRGQGSHFVWTRPFMLRAYVLPLVLSPALTR